MEEKNHLDNLKLKQLRADIQAGIASGDAGTLDIHEIKRRARARAPSPCAIVSDGTRPDRNHPAIEPSLSWSVDNAQ